MKNALVIPVRLNSTRLPNKALKDINGISLIQRVVNQCLKTNVFTYVVTDSPEISSKVVLGSGGSIFYQNKKAESGTERIANIIDSIDADNIINVQGDQPFISPKAILEMCDYMDKNPDHDIVTPVSKHREEKYSDPSKCKVVLSLSGRAIYFSRSPIPYNASESYGHLGIYGYKKSFLKNYHKLKVSQLEKVEKLEQLRFIDNDVPIQTYMTEHSIFSVDTPTDLQYAIEHTGELG